MNTWRSILCFISFVTLSAQAQLAADDPDWKESQVSMPGAVNMNKKSLISVEVSGSSQLKWFVDGDSIQVGNDGVVRYVVIAQSESGFVNAMYEGIRCTKADMRLYARYTNNSWVEQKNMDWTALSTTPGHTRVLARQGLCEGSAPPLNTQAAINKLKNPYANP